LISGFLTAALMFAVVSCGSSGNNAVVRDNAPPQVYAGADQLVTWPVDQVVLHGEASDDGLPAGVLDLLWSKVSGPGAVTFGDASAQSTTATFSSTGVYVLRLTADDTALSASDDVTVTVNSAPQVNAGADQIVAWPVNTVALTGTASDDGLPAGVLDLLWSKVSGPGAVTFGDAFAQSTTATFSSAGVYVLRLTADDTALSASDDVTVTVNSAPQVNAGADQTITWPVNTVALTGTASDDGLPVGVLDLLWSKVSGPGTVTFGDEFAQSTKAAFSTFGVYVLRLTADDTVLSASDDVTVTVLPDDEYVGIGDSITRGSGDDISSDGLGYQPILADLLTAAKGYSHYVFNEGVSGHTAADGSTRIDTVLGQYSRATYFLVQYGTNDAKLVPTPRPSGLGLSRSDPGYPGTFKDHMQRIIDAIFIDGRIAYIAKLPKAFGSFDFMNPLLQEYNEVADELYWENELEAIPPDFYTLFETNPDQMADDLHPNGIGYQSMAQLWWDAIIDAGP
jgi:lysophospholipase L1-like esterase